MSDAHKLANDQLSPGERVIYTTAPVACASKRNLALVRDPRLSNG